MLCNFRKKSLIILVFIIFLSSIGILNFYGRNNRKEITKLYDYHPAVLSVDAGHILSFGYTNLLADYFWLYTVQYLGSHVIDGSYKSLNALFTLVNGLDPYFQYPYKMALLIFADYNLDQAIEIGKTGMKYNPENYEIPYFLGYTHSFLKDNPSLGAAYFDYAGSVPGAPKVYSQIGSAMRRQSGLLERSYEFWLHVISNSKDTEELRKANTEIIRISNMIYLRDFAKKYIEIFKKDPDFYMHDLVNKGIIPKIPDDPVTTAGYGWYPDEQVVKLTLSEFNSNI